MSRTLHRSYFDLLKEKYPEPGEPGVGFRAAASDAVAVDRRGGRRSDVSRSDVSVAASRQGSWLLAVVLCLLAASLLILFLGPLELPGADRRASERRPPAAPPTAEPRVAEPPAAALQISPPTPQGPRTVEPAAEPRTAELRAPELGAAAPKVVAAPVEARTAELRSESRAPEATPAAATAPPPARQAAESQPPPRTRIGVRIFAPQPAYPAAARRLGIEGSVLVEARVDGSGRVSDVQVVEGSSPELDRAAVEALHRWRFEPARLGGDPLAYRFRQEFRFSIEPAAAPAHRPAEAPQTLAAGDEVTPPVTPPVKLATPLPGYTPAAWAAGVEGEVELRATIDERGEVAGVEVVRGLPHGLTEAAVAAVQRWKFRPATRDGEPVAVEHHLRLRFAL